MSAVQWRKLLHCYVCFIISSLFIIFFCPWKASYVGAFKNTIISQCYVVVCNAQVHFNPPVVRVVKVVDVVDFFFINFLKLFFISFFFFNQKNKKCCKIFINKIKINYEIVFFLNKNKLKCFHGIQKSSGARSNLGGKAKPSNCGRTDIARGCRWK